MRELFKYDLYDEAGLLGTYSAQEIAERLYLAKGTVYEAARNNAILTGGYRIQRHGDVEPYQCGKKESITFLVWDGDKLIARGGTKKIAEMLGVRCQYLRNVSLSGKAVKGRYIVTREAKDEKSRYAQETA